MVPVYEVVNGLIDSFVGDRVCARLDIGFDDVGDTIERLIVQFEDEQHVEQGLVPATESFHGVSIEVIPVNKPVSGRL